MKRITRLSVFAMALVACRGQAPDDAGDDGGTGGPTGDDPCGECPPGGYAVDCGYLWGLGEFTMCGINQDNAEFLCLSTWGGVLKSSPSDNCPTPSGDAWDPAVHIYPDPSGGAVVIIEAELLDRLEQYPQDIYLDATRLDWDDNGEVVVASEGQLSRALGLRKGDVLLDVNGYPFGEILDTVQLYSTLRGAPKLKLAFARDGRQQTAQYRIQ